MNPSAENPRRSIPGWVKAIFFVVLISAMVVVVWTQLPRSGISTDLSVVGGDKPVLVLTRDVNLLFRVAHQGQPAGRAFAREHNTQDGDLTLVDEAGEVIGRMVQPRNSAEIAQLLAPPSAP